MSGFCLSTLTFDTAKSKHLMHDAILDYCIYTHCSAFKIYVGVHRAYNCSSNKLIAARQPLQCLAQACVLSNMS